MPGRMAGLVMAAMFFSIGCAHAAARTSAVYCHKHGKDLYGLAAKILPDGRLSFGITYWQGGSNIGVMGIAEKRGRDWEYARRLGDPDPNVGCKVTIRFDPAGTTVVTGDPKASCRGGPWMPDNPDVYSGGQGTELGTVLFTRRTYRGAVTYELDDVQDFFSGAGLLAADRC